MNFNFNLTRRQRILAGSSAGAGVILLTAVTLWVAGALGGGGEEATLDDACAAGFPRPTTCPSPGVSRTRTPSASRTATGTPTPSPSGSPTRTPAPTFGPTPAFPTPTHGTATPTPTAVPTPPPTAVPYRLVQDVSTATFARMVDFAIIPGRPDEAVVITQLEARLRRVSISGAFAPTDYGDLSDRVEAGGSEQGLLSLAFSPDFAADGRIYVYYTSKNCGPSVSRCVRLSRFQVTNNDMDEAGEVVVLEVNQQLGASNHNGGRILFGPELANPFLYVSIGDGGGGGDPLETGQNNNDLLGNILRLDVTGQATYTVPAGNPFVGGPGADEVWAYGLRNPWRFSFDRATNLLWLGDVGQGSWEEVDVIEKGGNYGWDCMEGESQYEFTGCTTGAYALPRAVYATHEGAPSDPSCAITGGYVYRGSAMPELLGRYIYADYCSGRIWALDSGNPDPNPVLLLDSDKQISSFAELPNGELLLVTFQNAMYRLTR